MAIAHKNKGLIACIGTTLADPALDTFTAIKRVTGVSDLGGDAPILDVTALEDSSRQKQKGIRDSGDIELSGNRVWADAGQNALEAAEQDDGDEPYNLYLLFPGQGAGGTDVKLSFKAIVSKFMDNPGDVDSVIAFSSTVAITGGITKTEV